MNVTDIPRRANQYKTSVWLLTLLRFNLTIRGEGETQPANQGAETKASDQSEHGADLVNAMFWWKVIWWNVSRSKLITLTGENNPQFCWINNFPWMFPTHTRDLRLMRRQWPVTMAPGARAWSREREAPHTDGSTCHMYL